MNLKVLSKKAIIIALSAVMAVGAVGTVGAISGSDIIGSGITVNAASTNAQKAKTTALINKNDQYSKITRLNDLRSAPTGCTYNGIVGVRDEQFTIRAKAGSVKIKGGALRLVKRSGDSYTYKVNCNKSPACSISWVDCAGRNTIVNFTIKNTGKRISSLAVEGGNSNNSKSTSAHADTRNNGTIGYQYDNACAYLSNGRIHTIGDNTSGYLNSCNLYAGEHTCGTFTNWIGIKSAKIVPVKNCDGAKFTGKFKNRTLTFEATNCKTGAEYNLVITDAFGATYTFHFTVK